MGQCVSIERGVRVVAWPSRATRACKGSVVGTGLPPHVGLASRMFKALPDEGITIQMISSSAIKLGVVIDEKYLELAVRVLHKAFELEQAPRSA